MGRCRPFLHLLQLHLRQLQLLPGLLKLGLALLQLVLGLLKPGLALLQLVLGLLKLSLALLQLLLSLLMLASRLLVLCLGLLQLLLQRGVLHRQVRALLLVRLALPHDIPHADSHLLRFNRGRRCRRQLLPDLQADIVKSVTADPGCTNPCMSGLEGRATRTSSMPRLLVLQ